MFQHQVDVPPLDLAAAHGIGDVLDARLVAHDEMGAFAQDRLLLRVWTPAHPDDVAHALSTRDCTISHEVGDVLREALVLAVGGRLAAAPAGGVVES